MLGAFTLEKGFPCRIVTMNVTSTINIKQTQGLNMSMNLQQAIRLLQLSSIELENYVHEQIAENPLLIAKDDTTSAVSKSENINSKSNSDWDKDDFLQCYTQAQSLKDFLLEQLHSLVNANTQEFQVAFALIEHIDERGYLDTHLENIAKDLNIGLEKVEQALRLIHQMEPTGIGARNLIECLTLQLQEKKIYDNNFKLLLENLSLVAEKGISSVSKIININVSEIQAMLETIRTLNPRPASGFLHTANPDILIPDGFVELSDSGVYHFRLNLEHVPEILLNTSYYHELKKTLRSPRDMAYISKQYQQANWLISALQQRYLTLQKVASAITEQQHSFFKDGISGLKPLTLKNLANQLDLHESTISRITTNKYIMTPRGNFELKFFFSQGITSIQDGTEMISSRAVKSAISRLVKDEPAKMPLSDEQIVAKLGEEGIIVARRTIAKYRGILNIPSSSKRRQDYSINPSQH